MAMKCPKCGAENYPGSKCRSCGEPLPMEADTAEAPRPLPDEGSQDVLETGPDMASRERIVMVIVVIVVVGLIVLEFLASEDWKQGAQLALVLGGLAVSVGLLGKRGLKPYRLYARLRYGE